jgi:putative NADH-flavin reductase
MRLTIFGATGRIGRELVGQAVASGHEVTAVVRDPARLAAGPVRRLRVDFDDPDPAILRDAVQGADAVLSAVGPAPASNAGVASRATSAIAGAMPAGGVRRLVVVSAAPIGPVRVAGETRPIQRDGGDDALTRVVLGPLLRRIFRAQYADLARMEDGLRSSGLDWTSIRPPRLTDGPLTGAYRTAIGRNLPGGRQISRADVAHFMLAVLDRPETIGETVGIASAHAGTR